jgi:hypothetical protein
MDEFVNYKKRDINLPYGCKDLHDVLRFMPARTIVRRGESVTGALSEIGKFVAMVLESRAKTIMLWVRSPEDELSVFIGHLRGNPVRTTVNFQEDSALEAKLLDFIARRGLKGLERSDIPPYLCLPEYLVLEVSPLPSDGPSISELITDLFEHVCGARGNSELSFTVFETGNAASQPRNRSHHRSRTTPARVKMSTIFSKAR